MRSPRFALPMFAMPAWNDIEQNLDALRTQLAQRVAVFLISTCGLAMWLSIPLDPFPLAAFLLCALLFVQAWIVIRIIATRPDAARYLLVGCLVLSLLLSFMLFEAPWLPFAGVVVIFTCAVLVRHSEIGVTALTILATAALVFSGVRTYPIEPLVIMLLCSGVVAGLLVGTVYTALEWESMSRQRSDKLLAEIRDHRAQLSQMVKQLNQALELQRRTQQELVRARNAADEARRSKERFAANISHELRTPLNLVLGFSEVMYKTPEVYGQIVWPPKLRRDISQIYRNSRHLIEMIDDILDLSRVEIAGFALNTEPTPLAPLIADVAEIAADMFRNHPARFVVEVEDDLPTLELDRTRFRQVLLNLLNNARRFTESGEVKLSARQTAQELIVEVSDTGIGVAPEKLPHIFDEFYQADSSLRRSRNGAGLGLAISKRFVEAHGGHISVESVQGQGTTFRVGLPLRRASLLPIHETRATSAPDSRPVILVVDRDPMTADRLARSLQRFDVLIGYPDETLQERVASLAPCAIIWNAADNHPVTAELLETTGIPVIELALSRRNENTAHKGPLARLSKPITAEQLLREVESFGEVERILVIDDDVGFTQLIQRMIEASGLPVVVQQAFGGYEGLEVMQQMLPDLVLLDNIMPDLTGYQVLSKMRDDPRLCSVPVLLLTEDTLLQAGPVVTGPLVVHNLGRWHFGELLRLLKGIMAALPASQQL
ncbi:MAG: hybrid sensor histidine kinase/response regulator [Chloroflexota bacterium]|nr:MAG: hypothetical protein DIU68_18960 [Chloroflexota bacterium]